MNLYNKNEAEIIEEFSTNISEGLSIDEVDKRRAESGENILTEGKRKSTIIKFLENFKEFMVIVLIIASVISFTIGEVIDGIIILAIVFLNATISTIQSEKAEKALSALKEIAAPKSIVIRNGAKVEILAKEIVPGDVVLLEAGNIVPSDGRIVECSSLRVDESALTGESLPVEKISESIDKTELGVGDRVNMVFSSTIITYGHAIYVVTSTGMETEIGKIATLMNVEKEEITPLQEKLDEIGKKIGLLVIVVCALIFVLGIIQNRDTFEMFFVAVSLSVAAIPEGLPAIVTIILALGVQRLSKKNAVIRNLPAVETLGSSSVICSDKTGTLTENKMTVVDEFSNDKEDGIYKEQMMYALLLCNDATVSEGVSLGDPTETALFEYAVKSFGDVDKILESSKRIFDIPFDSKRKLMSTVNEAENGRCVYTKGGLDEILEKCTKIVVEGEIVDISDELIENIKKENEKMASNALRVLGVAFKNIQSENYTNENTESDLTFLGIVGMIDPIREEVKDAINVCKIAGIRPVMITGDHKLTATAIAKELEIIESEDQVMTGKELEKLSQEAINEIVENIGVYARVSPEHKVKIVKGWQSKNKVVAMTGDGVNDAPALKMAEIGVAMGIVGTDVARNSSDMVLMDDNFATIVTAINEGRGIYQNIKKTIRYLLSCNIGEVLLLVTAMLGNLEVPLLPIHILWVNLVTDSFPALALGMEPLEDNAMTMKPRKKGESIFSEGLTKNIVREGIEVGSVAFLIYIYSLKLGIDTARTMAFIAIVFTQLFHSLSVRSEVSIIFKKGLFSNKYLVYAIFISSSMQISIVTVPFFREIFKVRSLSLNNWLIVIGASSVPFLISEFSKILKIKNKKKNL